MDQFNRWQAAWQLDQDISRHLIRADVYEQRGMLSAAVAERERADRLIDRKRTLEKQGHE